MMKTTRMPLPGGDRPAPTEPSPPAPPIEPSPQAPPPQAPAPGGHSSLPPLPPLAAPPGAPLPRPSGMPGPAPSAYGPPPGGLPPLPPLSPREAARNVAPQTVRLPLGQGPLPPLTRSGAPVAPAPMPAPEQMGARRGGLPPFPRTGEAPALAAATAPPPHGGHTAPASAFATARGTWRPTLKVGIRPPQAHPLAEPLYWACVDLFTLAAQFGMGNQPPPIQDLRHHLKRLFDSMEARARAAGVTPEDIRDAQFPIMALFDEILVQMPWHGQQEWRAHPLQVHYFHDNAAGETFFNGLPLLMRQPHRAHVLSIYFFCLALGFQGRHAVSGARELDAIYEQVGTAIGAIVPPSDVISPQAEARDGGRHFFQREAPIVRIGLICFGFAFLLFMVLRLVLSSQVSHARQPMDDYARGAGVGAP